MIRIAICDDEERDRVKLQKTLNDIALKCNIVLQIALYDNGIELLADKKEYDLIFLDIDMGDINGIETAEQIRSFDMNIPIVYVTYYSDYLKRAYKVHAFEYITKPYRFEDIESVVQDFLISLKGKNEKKISFVTGNDTVVLNMNSILYLHLSSRRCVEICTLYGNYTASENFNSIIERLDEEQFYKTARDYAVNLNYVVKINHKQGVILRDSSIIPLSLSKYSDFYARLSHQLRQI